MIVDIETFSDSDFYRLYKYVSDATLLTPVDLSGSSLRMMVRANAASATVFMEMSTLNERIIIDFLSPGVFSLRIPLSELSVLSAGVYVHSLIRTRPDSFKEQVWQGSLTHSIGPTR
jgi:hypothetical protein